MKIIYEREIETEEGKSFEECEEEEATHIHYCYNEDDLCKPCKREKL